MHDAAQPLGAQCSRSSASVSSQASRVWITMGLLRVAGDAHLLDEYVALDVAGREVVVIVEADLAYRDHFRDVW